MTSGGVVRTAALVAVLAASGSRTAAAELRVATYNVQALGHPKSTAYRALVDVLGKLRADVVLVQEISAEAGDLPRVGDLAREAGYPHRCLSEISGTLSGALYTACLSRLPIARCVSWSAAELAASPDANDITRDVLEVQVRGGETLWGFFTVHLKGGHGEREKFRRQVEVERLAQALRKFIAEHPGSPVVLGGDFNEDARQGPFGTPVFARAPAGLPGSYRLGPDLSFPVVYDPFGTLAALGLRALDAVRPGSAGSGTRWVSGARLDYLWIGPGVTARRAEVHDACAGSARGSDGTGRAAPPCGATLNASDHLGVVADLAARPRLTGTSESW